MAEVSNVQLLGSSEAHAFADETARNNIGNLSDLSTEDRANLVAAINELVATVGNLSGETGGSNCGITYIESSSEDPMVLRNLESNTYVLKGKFLPYAGSTRTLSFSSNLLVNIITKTAGTHVQVFYPVNNVVQFLSITDDSYERTDIKLNEMSEALTSLGDLSALSTTDKSSLVAALNELVSYAYGMEKVCKYVTTSDAVLEVNSDEKTVSVNAGYLFYRNARINTTAATSISIDQTSVYSLVVWDVNKKSFLSIAPSAFDATAMFMVAVLNRDYVTTPTANYVAGPYKVNGCLYNAPESQAVYVATNGSDAYGTIGDRNHPYKTIGKAIKSGAKTIFVMAGTYKEAVTASCVGGEIEIIAKPLSNNNSRVVIDLSQTLTMVADSATGLVKASYGSTATDFIHKVFVEKTESLTASDSTGYSCNIWSGDNKLTPVLTLDECKATEGTWFYDGSTVYANADAGTYALDNGSVNNGIYLEYFKKVKLMGIEVRYGKENAVCLIGCSDAEISRCTFAYAGLYMGLALTNTSAVVRNCEAKYNGKDGLNIHGVCTADFIDCVSHDNGDDGISHHDQSGGMVIGGEYYNNVKGGVCSPTFGSRNGINGVYTHHNGQGIYALADTDGEYPVATVTGCAIVNNTVGIRVRRYSLNCWNNVLVGNTTDTKEEDGGNITVIGQGGNA